MRLMSSGSVPAEPVRLESGNSLISLGDTVGWKGM